MGWPGGFPFSGQKNPDDAVERAFRVYQTLTPVSEALYRGICGLDIDIRRFQGVFFDKCAARFNGVAH
ncbi:MAG TPA: hypothetical protein DIW62_10380, partial [Raoultella sp.]|nr:hypothetical protein [Raoultella sp.]